MTPEQLRLVVVLYVSALVPLGLIPWLQYRRIIPTWSIRIYLLSFLLCAAGWEIWFTYGLLDGDPVTDRRAAILNEWIPIHLNWVLNSLGDAGVVCLLGLYWMWLCCGRSERVFRRWHWGGFAILLGWSVGQNMLVEMYLYHDQLSVGKTISWAPLVPTGPWFNPTLFEFHGRTITFQNQVCWVIMPPILYGLVLWQVKRGENLQSSPRAIPATERFDNVHFDPRTETREHRINVAQYTCPECDYRIRFTTHDFLRSEPYSCFTEKQKILADTLRPLDLGNEEDFFEFLCPGCQLPVRVVFWPDREFAMGCYTYELVTVVELPAPRCG
ncbi:MAG: hypothetical protein MK108_13525 [Mariniblastus sp.]|nr:hypothetical protein [Mariniblastus sp.]